MPRRPTIFFRHGRDGGDMPEPTDEEVAAAWETLRRGMGTFLVVSGFSSLGQYPGDALWFAGEAAWGYVLERSFYGRWPEAEWDQWYGRWSEAEWAQWREQQVTVGNDMAAVDGGAAEEGEESDVTRDSMSMTTIGPQ